MQDKGKKSLGSQFWDFCKKHKYKIALVAVVSTVATGGAAALGWGGALAALGVSPGAYGAPAIGMLITAGSCVAGVIFGGVADGAVRDRENAKARKAALANGTKNTPEEAIPKQTSKIDPEIQKAANNMSRALEKVEGKANASPITKTLDPFAQTNNSSQRKKNNAEVSRD